MMKLASKGVGAYSSSLRQNIRSPNVPPVSACPPFDVGEPLASLSRTQNGTALASGFAIFLRHDNERLGLHQIRSAGPVHAYGWNNPRDGPGEQGDRARLEQHGLPVNRILRHTRSHRPTHDRNDANPRRRQIHPPPAQQTAARNTVDGATNSSCAAINAISRDPISAVRRSTPCTEDPAASSAATALPVRSR